MTLAHILEDFGVPSSTGPADPAVLSEEEKASAFENGYNAGWEDAVKAQSQDQTRIGTDLAQNLNELAFTYHEAKNHILKSVAPLITQMVEHVLPQMAHAALGAKVAELASEAAATQAGQPIKLMTAPINRDALKAALEGITELPVDLQDEPSLGEGQVRLCLDGGEMLIDLDELVGQISELTTAFFEQADERAQYG